MMHKTLRFRLTILSALAGILLFLVAGMVMSYQYRRDLLRDIDGDLVRIAKTGQPDRAPLEIEDSEIIKKAGNEYFRVTAGNGRITFEHINGIKLWPVNMESLQQAFRGSPQFETVIYRGERFRTLYFPVDEATVVRIGRSIEEIEKDAASLNRHFLTLSPFIIVVISVVSWIILGKSLAPIAKVQSVAEQIRQGSGTRISLDIEKGDR
jgi:uncharacterized membrane protein YraQ (UPF0718 family)